ncbi:MAG: M48 family metallopeptidase [Fimbriimonas sp.]
MRNFATAIAATAALGATAVAPAQFSKPNADQQVKLGKQAAAEVRQKERVLPASDSRVQTLRRVARRVLRGVSDGDKPWEYSFDVVDSPEVNAFALPGGPTFFYTGLLNRMKNEDELAAVLAHELTHVRKEHWAYQYRDQQSRNAFFTLGALILRPSRDVMNVAGLGLSVLVDLPFSRKHETEADRIGYDLMVKAGYNPQGMVDVFEMLRQASQGGKPPEFLSTHPDDRNRIRTIQERIRKEGKNYPAMTRLPWAK